jgi:hypothetical protein
MRPEATQRLEEIMQRTDIGGEFDFWITLAIIALALITIGFLTWNRK